MKPIDYIYKNIDCLNLIILRQLIYNADEEVSEDIYDYLNETPQNTNPSILKVFGLDIERSENNSDSDEDIGKVLFSDENAIFESGEEDYYYMSDNSLDFNLYDYDRIKVILDSNEYICNKITSGDDIYYGDKEYESFPFDLSINNDGQLFIWTTEKYKSVIIKEA